MPVAGRPRKYGEEDPSNPAWAKHKKHFFVLSSSGKPIYTKYGHENRLSTFMVRFLPLLARHRRLIVRLY